MNNDKQNSVDQTSNQSPLNALIKNLLDQQPSDYVPFLALILFRWAKSSSYLKTSRAPTLKRKKSYKNSRDSSR